jgi:hypothetical protein
MATREETQENDKRIAEKSLTIAMLKAMAPKTIFTRGEAVDGPLGINMTGDGQMLRWCAVLGVIPDWAIYVGRQEQSYEEIARTGDKVYDSATIRLLVPCDKEALGMYRA